MKSAKEIGPSRAIRSRSRSATAATWARIIVSPMRPRCALRGVLAAALVLATACASKHGKLPTLEDYSDGTSTYAAEFLAAWKAGGLGDALLAPSLRWSGPLPGDALTTAPSRAPLVVATYRAAVPPAGSAVSDAPALRAKLAALRAEFASLGRTEAEIFGFDPRGKD